jgi:hypothetical protein
VKLKILTEKAAENAEAGKEAMKRMAAVSSKEGEPAAKKLKAKESEEPAACSKPGVHRKMNSFFKLKQQQEEEDKAVAGTFPWDYHAPCP